MHKEIVIHADPKETRVAILEDKSLVELLAERPDTRRIVGDIYKGKVNAVLPGMQAAFVEIGLAKTAFLHASDLAASLGEDIVFDDEDDESDEDDADESVDVFPNQTELEAAALGDEPFAFEEEIEPPIRVKVACGDLAYASNPVAVGHYEGDTIVSAERALDDRLDRRLSRRYRLGRYPGPIGSSAVILGPRPGAKPGGAIVVGLGAGISALDSSAIVRCG